MHHNEIMKVEVYILDKGSTEERNACETKAKSCIAKAVDYIRTGSKGTKSVPPQRVFRYLDVIPIEDLMQELVRREETEFIQVCDENIKISVDGVDIIKEHGNGVILWVHNKELLRYLTK